MMEALIITADANRAHVLAALLGLCGVESRLCPSIKKAAIALEEAQAQIVFSDTRLPDGGIRKVVNTVSSSCPATPLIACCSSTSLRAHEEAVRAGAADSLAPPFPVGEIQRIILETVHPQA